MIKSAISPDVFLAGAPQAHILLGEGCIAGPVVGWVRRPGASAMAFITETASFKGANARRVYQLRLMSMTAACDRDIGNLIDSVLFGITLGLVVDADELSLSLARRIMNRRAQDGVNLIYCTVINIERLGTQRGQIRLQMAEQWAISGVFGAAILA